MVTGLLVAAAVVIAVFSVSGWRLPLMRWLDPDHPVSGSYRRCPTEMCPPTGPTVLSLAVKEAT
jgi:hypothetical protein